MSIAAVQVTPKRITLVADSQATSGTTKTRTCKAFRVGDVMFAGAGLVSDVHLFATHLEEHPLPRRLDKRVLTRYLADFYDRLSDTEDSPPELLVVADSRAYVIEHYSVELVRKHAAIGAAAEAALVGLDMGGPIEQVLRAVCKRNASCSTPLRILHAEKTQTRRTKTKK